MTINNNAFPTAKNDTWETVKIDLNGDDISDLIFYRTKLLSFQKCKSRDGYYYNAMTQEKSKNIKDVIRKDKRFIIVKRSMKDIENYHQEYGFYAKYVEELDILIIVSAEFKKVRGKWKWVEIERFFFTRDLRSNFRRNINSFWGYDICGQTAYNDEKWYEDIRYLNNFAVNSRKKAIEFFGGFIWSYKKQGCDIVKLCDFDSMSDFDNISDFRDDSFYNSDVSVVVGMLEYGCEGMELGDVPQSFVNKIKEKASKRLWEHTSWCCSVMNRFVGASDFNTSYLQQVGDCYIQRCFRCIYDYKYPLYDSEITMIEYLRVKVDLNMQNKNFMCVPVDGYNIGKDTCFSHVVDLIAKFDMWYNQTSNLAYKDYLMPVMINVAAYSPFEKLINLNIGEASRYYQRVNITRFINYLEKYPFLTAAEYMKELFGEIDESQTELHKALGIPKGLLEHVIQKDKRLNFEYIGIMKRIFATNPGYLKRMDNISYQNLYDSVEGVMMSYHPSLATQTLANLVFLFGHENWRGYIAHVQKLQAIKDGPVWQGDKKFPNIREYSDYIEKLVAIKKNVDIDFPMQWKLYGNKITEAELAIRDSYNIIVDEKEYADCTRKFLECSDKWKEYEYVGEDYVIKHPKKPSELVNEGFWLNHCAKSYVEAVASQKTIVLFIRRKTCPDKPFYTLEIRDGEIRQCHGHNNINIDSAPGLEDFLKTYCDEKHIIYHKGDSCLHV